MKQNSFEQTEGVRALIKRFSLFRGDPTTRELEMLTEIQGRVRLVVKTRWTLLLLLSIYGAYAGGFFFFSGTLPALELSQMFVLFGSLVAVTAYNLFYQLYYRELSHVLFINHLQILLDILFVTVLVHFSGGVSSWFWTVYLILTLEAAFLLDRKADVWFIGAAGGLIYGALLTMEFYDVLPPPHMPFTNPLQQHDFVYVMLMWFWVCVMNGTVAIIGAFFMETIRRRERELKQMVIKDQMTGLYNREYFFRMLNSEIQRSLRYSHVFAVILLDLDNFKRYNDTYGHLEGDRLIKAVAQLFRRNVRRSETAPPYDIDVPCRYGGEEFGIILPETPPRADGAEAGASALAFAERIRRGVEALDFDGRRITVSIGVSSFPGDGITADELVREADEALYRAKKGGKNRVVLAAER